MCLLLSNGTTTYLISVLPFYTLDTALIRIEKKPFYMFLNKRNYSISLHIFEHN